jgi:DNA adenine methylase
MRYLGGKKKIGEEIAEVLKKYAPPGSVNGYIEPFCGCLSITIHMVDDYKVSVSDIQKDLIILWKETKSGTFKYPKDVSKKTWLRYKTQPPSAMRAFIGFGCSFGGKWFSTYAGDYCEKDYCKVTKTSIEKLKPFIKKINRISCKSYNKYDNPKLKDYLIYCDPPYKDTAEYRATNKFDHEKFWDIIRKWSKHNIVIVSEFKAPKDFKCIWKKIKETNWGGKVCKITEKLFMKRN